MGQFVISRFQRGFEEVRKTSYTVGEVESRMRSKYIIVLNSK